MGSEFLTAMMITTMFCLLAVISIEFLDGGHKRLKRTGYVLIMMVFAEAGYLLVLNKVGLISMSFSIIGKQDIISDYIIPPIAVMVSKLFIICVNIVTLAIYYLGRGKLYDKLFVSALYKGNLRLINLILDIDLVHSEEDIFNTMKQHSIVLKLKLDILEEIYDKHKHLNEYTKEMSKDLFIVWEVLYSGLVTQEDLEHGAIRVLHSRFKGKENELIREYKNYIAGSVSKEFRASEFIYKDKKEQEPRYDMDMENEIILLSRFNMLNEMAKSAVEKELIRTKKVYLTNKLDDFLKYAYRADNTTVSGNKLEDIQGSMNDNMDYECQSPWD